MAILLKASSFEAASASQVLTYKEWKKEQVTRATNYSVKAKNQWTLSNRRGDSPRLKERYKADLEYAKHMIEITKEFTIKDYVSQYLTRLPQREAKLRQIAKRMSKEEVHSLLVEITKTTKREAVAVSTSKVSSKIL